MFSLSVPDIPDRDILNRKDFAMKYTDLIFDLYGTLVDIHTDQTKEEVWEKTALYFGFQGAPYRPEELREEFNGLAQREEEKLTASSVSGSFQSYECYPELQIDLIFEELFRKKGIQENSSMLAVSAAHLFRIVSLEYIRLYPHVEDALALLRRNGLRLWLLSNAQRVFTESELRLLNLEGFFDGIYLSSDYNCRKPDKRFFRRLITEQGLDVNRSLMIGNVLTTDMGGARKSGLPGFYIHSNLSPAEDDARLSSSSGAPAEYFFEGTDWNQIAQKLLQICRE